MSEEKIQDENGLVNEQNPMVQRISLEVQRREPNSMKELVLDNCARCSSIQGLTDEFSNLRVLSIINVGLQSLAKFPQLPKLRKLYLSDNRLTSGLENLQGCPNLTLLILAGNKFKAIEEIQPLTKLTKLSILDLMNCEVTKVVGYKETMFNILPKLKYLDNADKDGVDKDSDEEDEDEDNEQSGEDDEDEEEEEEEEEEEDESKTGLKALYDGTFQEGDDDEDEEESYEGKSEEEEESDEDEELSDADLSADPVEVNKGEKRKNGDDEEEEEEEDEEGPPRKI